MIYNLEDKSLHKIKPDTQTCTLDIDINCSFKLWINGNLVHEHKKSTGGNISLTIENLNLVKGLNRFIIATGINNEDIRLRPIFKYVSGEYMKNLKYQLTIDEVDPK